MRLRITVALNEIQTIDGSRDRLPGDGTRRRPEEDCWERVRSASSFSKCKLNVARRTRQSPGVNGIFPRVQMIGTIRPGRLLQSLERQPSVGRNFGPRRSRCGLALDISTGVAGVNLVPLTSLKIIPRDPACWRDQSSTKDSSARYLRLLQHRRMSCHRFCFCARLRNSSKRIKKEAADHKQYFRRIA